MELGPRHKGLLRHLWHAGAASRSELAARLALRPNTVGELTASLVEAQVLREGEPDTKRVGRPRIPLDLDPEGRQVLGVAISPGQAEAVALNLLGEPRSSKVTTRFPTSGPVDPIAETRELIAPLLGPQALSMGLTVTGFIDEESRQILFSSVLPLAESISLEPLWQAAGDTSVAVGNDMHATAARWFTAHNEPQEDILLVQFGDTSLGAAYLVEGRLCRGSIHSANELGHSRFMAPTHICYCGQTGCLEQICGTDFLHHLDQELSTGLKGDLGERVAGFSASGQDPALDRVLDYLVLGISNAVNFCRPHRLVLTSSLPDHQPLTEHLSERVSATVLPALRDRLSVETWNSPTESGAETAAWLALTGLFCDGWD